MLPFIPLHPIFHLQKKKRNVNKQLNWKRQIKFAIIIKGHWLGSVDPLCKSRDFSRFTKRDKCLFAKYECTKVKIAQFKNYPNCISSKLQVQIKLKIQTESQLPNSNLLSKMPRKYKLLSQRLEAVKKEDFWKISKRTKSCQGEIKYAEENCMQSNTFSFHHFPE